MAKLKPNQPFSLEFDTRRFSNFVNNATKNMTNGKADVVETIAANLISAIIDNTPVDTGRARAGWTAYADAKHVPYTITGPNVTGEAISEGKSASSFQVKEISDSIAIRITNSVSYIMPLEFGHSKESPAGMVRLAMRTLRADRIGSSAAVKKQIINEIKRAARKAAKV